MSEVIAISEYKKFEEENFSLRNENLCLKERVKKLESERINLTDDDIIIFFQVMLTRFGCCNTDLRETSEAYKGGVEMIERQ